MLSEELLAASRVSLSSTSRRMRSLSTSGLPLPLALLKCPWPWSESGEYHWRDGGEPHVNDPTAIANIQDAVRTKNDKSYEAYSIAEYERIKDCTLRGLLDFKFDESKLLFRLTRSSPGRDRTPICYWRHVLRIHFHGIPLHTLAVAMNRLGGKSNTGEGGEDPERSLR
jgi:glutamate synthase (NADPH/NADH)